MKLLMISGDRSILQGKNSAFWYAIQELRKHWDRIDIICPRVKEVDIEISGMRHSEGENDGRGEVFFHSCPQNLWHQSRWIAKKGKLLVDEFKHDVMTVHDYPPFYNGIGAKRLAKKIKIPYALEVHHIVGWPRAASFSEWIGRILSWMYFCRASCKATAVRVVNETVKKKLISWGVKKKKISVVPSFYLDGELLRQKLQPPVSYDISFCSRLVPNKGLSNVLDAVAILKNIRLLVVGTGPDRALYEAKVKRLGLGDRVMFLGWLPTQEAVVGAIQTARIFVMNSKSEGGPRVVLEAMGCGMPVIVTKVGVMPEIIKDGENGIFTTGESEDLAEKIGMLLEDEKKQERLGKEAKNILKKYDRVVLVKKYADFLKSLV